MTIQLLTKKQCEHCGHVREIWVEHKLAGEIIVGGKVVLKNKSGKLFAVDVISAREEPDGSIRIESW